MTKNKLISEYHFVTSVKHEKQIVFAVLTDKGYPYFHTRDGENIPLPDQFASTPGTIVLARKTGSSYELLWRGFEYKDFDINFIGIYRTTITAANERLKFDRVFSHVLEQEKIEKHKLDNYVVAVHEVDGKKVYEITDEGYRIYKDYQDTKSQLYDTIFYRPYRHQTCNYYCDLVLKDRRERVFEIHGYLPEENSPVIVPDGYEIISISIKKDIPEYYMDWDEYQREIRRLNR